MWTPDSFRWLKHSAALSYGTAVLSVIAALSIARWLDLQYGFEPLTPFLCAILFSAWFGGVKPGLLAVALSLLAFHHYFLIPMYPLGMEKEIPRLLFAALISGFIVMLSAAQRSAIGALRESDQRYHSLFDNMAEGVVYLRILFENGEPRDAICLEVNRAWEHWAGSRNVIGRRMSEVSPGFREMRPEPFERVVRAAITGRSERFETYSTALKKWLSISAYCPRKEHVIMVQDDITERKRAQDHLRLVIDTIPVMAWSLRPDGVVDFLNKRWVDYSGLTLEQYVQDPTSPIHPEDIPRVLKKWRAALAAGDSSEDEMRLRRADGEYRWFLVRTVPLCDEHGSVVKWLGASIDIEDRKGTEEALRQSEERFAAFMDNLPGYAWMKDLQGRYVYINQVVRGLSGYGSLGKTDAQIWPADLAAEYRANDQHVIAAKKPLHTVEHYLQEGKQRHMVGSKFPIFDKNGAVALVGGAGVDITERIEAEGALRESELRFRQLAENIQEVFWMTTPAMEELLHVSPAYENVWGRSLESLRQRPQSWMDAIHSEDRERVVGVLEGQRQRGFEVEYRIVRPDGSVRWIRDRRFPVKDESGKVYRIAGIAEDITERKRVIETLRQSEFDLAEAQRVAKMGNWTLDTAAGTVRWSEELYRIFDVDKATFEGTYAIFLSRVHPDDRPKVLQANAEARLDGKPFEIEYRITTPSGQLKHIREIGYASRDRSGSISTLFGTAQDITERKQAENAFRDSSVQLRALSRRLVELQESERRELSRELHDRVGQNLTALKINIDMLQPALASHGNEDVLARVADSAALLESTMDAIENVMSELRPPMLDDHGLAAALDWHASKFSRRTGIAVVVHAGEPAAHLAPQVEIALFRIAQEALNNIAKHAGARRAEIALDRENGDFVMSVRDDGIGFNAGENASDKPKTGLGMATMRERSQAVGGRFEVQALPERGTRLTVRVPC